MTATPITSIDAILNIFAIIAWVVFIIYVITQIIRWAYDDGFKIATIRLFSYRIMLPLLGVIAISMLSSSIVFVLPEQVSVVISAVSPGGIRPQPLRGGLHWIIPLIENSENYPVSWQTYTMSGNVGEGEENGDDSIRARTRDGQEVYLDTSLIFKINPDQAVLVHIDWQKRYIEDLIQPLIRGYVRTEVSQFVVSEVNSSARKDLESTLDKLIRTELESKGFILDQFLLRDITFSEQYARAIEEKQVSQERQSMAVYQAEEKRKLAQGNADAILIEAKAQTDSFNLIGKTLSDNPDLLTYYYTQKLAPNIQVMLVPNNAPLILPLSDMMGNKTETAVSTPVTSTFSISPTTTVMPKTETEVISPIDGFLRP